jgi:predicted HTH transcriptional regulator
MNSEAEVVAMIQAGHIQEHLHKNVELKESWHQDHGHKISALANKLAEPTTWLIIGLRDDGTSAGKSAEWAKQTEETISQHINEKLDPIQTCAGITTQTINGASVLLVKLRNPGDVVYWGTNAYCASGTTQKKMEPEEILELRLKLPGLTDFSRQLVQSTYDLSLISRMQQRIQERGHLLECAPDPEKCLTALGLTGTQAARILFGTCPFRVVEFDSSDLPISQVTESGLYHLLTDEYQRQLQQRTARLARKEFNPYPALALKEALANAVAHAAYFEQSGDIILEIRPTSLTISNLCLRESQYFANRWFSRAHKTINAFLMEVLRIAGQVDELGRGKNVIFAESVRNGKRPPAVHLQKAGKYFRWSLTLHGDVSDRRQLRVFSRINNIYPDPRKALIAQALVLWSSKPVSEIKNYIDDTFSDAFADVLSSFDGPIFYHAEQDRIVLHRWVRLLLDEGKDSKQLSPAEETHLRSFVRQFCLKFEDGYISPAKLRELGHFSESSSAKTLSSQLLAKWQKQGHLSKLAHGKFQFIEPKPVRQEELKDILRQLLSSAKTAGSKNQPEREH